MSFAHPLLALGALAGALPIVVHLIDRRRARSQPFAALDFLLRSRRSNARRLRLKRLLLLALRMIALVALPLALARPHFARAGSGPGALATRGPAATVLVIDGSGSMRYRLSGSSLFERARRLARARLADLSAEDSVSVSLCAPREPAPPVPSFDHSGARELLDRLLPSEEPADLSSCAAQAAGALAGSQLPRRRIVVFTDGTGADWDLSRPPPTVQTAHGALRPEIEVVDAARAKLPNRAITDLSIRRAPEVGDHAYRFDFTVRSFSDAPARNVDVSLRSAGQVLARGFCDLPAEGAIRKSLAASFPPGQISVGEVALSPDDLSDDDARAFVLDVPRRSHALLVDGAPSPLRFDDEAYFLATALEAGGSGIGTRTIDPDALTPSDFDLADAVFILNVRALRPEVAAALSRFVRGGGGLFVSMGDRIDPEALGQSLGELLPMTPRVIKTAAPPPHLSRGEASGEENGLTDETPAHFSRVDAASPLFAPFSGTAGAGLTDVRIYRYVLVEPSGRPARVLASYEDGAPALVEAEEGKGRVFLFTSSVAREWSDWPIRTSFVPMMQEIARELSRSGEGRIEGVTLVGRSHELSSLPGMTPVSATSPSGKEQPLVRLPSGGIGLSAVPEAGIWRIRAKADGKVEDAPPLAFAAAFDPRESDTRRLAPGEIEARLGISPPPGIVEGDPGHRDVPLWTSLLEVVAVAFLLEGILLR